MKRLLALLVSGLLFTFGAINVHNAFLLIDYRDASNVEKVDVIIENGDFGIEIAKKLEAAGVVKTAKAFYRAALNQKRSESIPPGVHSIDIQISANSAIDQLLDKKRNRGVISFIEGLRTYEILDILAKSELLEGKFSGEIFPDPLFKTKNLEGFLFPAQYAFAPNTTVNEAVLQMLARFKISAKSSGLLNGVDGYSPYELLIIASIAQAEGDREDYAKIARVIFNRLEVNMPLQMNTTIDYAEKKRGNIRMSYKQLELNSKYNTYRYRGLTPTPIGSPGEAAMEAAVNPAKGDWLYFITVKPKETRFTNSYSEFSKWVIEFRKNEDAGLFK